ncbi:MAG: 50S ribosomal protein L5 [Candidatus Komeilibacteria bacterium RIFCSPLOWO2_01_FULL_52_15]|uniref:Large ribosomal subunit protein uL5 n=2 Tax=Candidatus Komeiliibacteriota TaxID=1817908 RepID=A0A1G2BPI4_9BACT|nr:MAG: 50S ribosomal protein L5 [Candidatus Komeilibacteria bacterium RIFCSPHIGHO2_01_FULL_52_14]OGY91011.1 MAG: 50S ribosomal protein L5 [Candidatus Komeilibacteria bacterium RIFCSPLOWO2_01_FULL_52_15]
MTRLRKEYNEKIAPRLSKELKRSNILAVPHLKKIVLNVGLSKSLQDKKYVDVAVATLTRITGQKPVLTKAKKSISNFKIREGMVVGAMVTLRRDRMYDFLDKLVHVALPRMRDFHGLDPKKGFDDNGNYSLGFREHIVFPEIRSDEIESVHGLEIAIATTAKNKQETRALLDGFGFPFKKEK